MVLSPIALPLALRTRRNAVRLAPAAGDSFGWVGQQWSGQPLRLLVLGESPVVGVGVDQLEQALAAQLAQALAAQLQRPVVWQACGENGITAVQAQARLLPDALAQRFDLTVLVFGVNDTTHLTSLARWQAALAGMAQAFNATGARVVFTAVPPLQHFSALPWLLRQLLGLRAALLDRRLSQVVAQVEAERHAVVLEFSAEYLACDGYHPSALGYRVWAEGLALSLAPGVRSSD